MTHDRSSRWVHATRGFACLAVAGVLLQFGGCAAAMLADVFFAVGPLLL